MKRKELVSKIKSMSISEIIMAMVIGLEEPRTRVQMSTFGMFEDGICYGCAATNTICTIADIKPKKKHFHKLFAIQSFETNSKAFISHFESAIDDLRVCDLVGYNLTAIDVGFAKIPKKYTEENLPSLQDDYTAKELDECRDFATRLVKT